MSEPPAVEFRTVLQLHGKSATGIEVPADLVESLGKGRKPPVAVTINGYTYRSTVAFMGGKYLLPVSAENRAAAKVAPGDEIAVRLVLDDAPREVDIPQDLAAALAADPAAAAAFAKLSFTYRKEHALSVASAKTDETRQRRLAKVIESLRG